MKFKWGVLISLNSHLLLHRQRCVHVPLDGIIDFHSAPVEHVPLQCLPRPRHPFRVVCVHEAEAVLEDYVLYLDVLAEEVLDVIAGCAGTVAGDVDV